MKNFFNPYNYNVDEVLREAHEMISVLMQRKAEKGWLDMIENEARFWANCVITNAEIGIMNNNVDKMRQMRKEVGIEA